MMAGALEAANTAAERVGAAGQDYDAWRELPREQLCDIVRVAAHKYDRKLDREEVSRRGDRHLPAVEESVDGIVDWAMEIDDYVPRAAGRYGERSSNGPAMAVLPRNDRGDLAPYVVSNMLLSRSPFVVRPSSRDAGSYVAEVCLDSFTEAVDEVLEGGQVEEVKEGMQLIYPLERGEGGGDRMRQTVEAFPDGGQLVLFGRDDHLEAMEGAIRDAGKEIVNAVKMGSGMSASALIGVEEENIPPYVEEIGRAAVFDRGDDCNATSVLYVETDIYPEVREELEQLEEQLEGGRPLDADADFVAVSDELLESARRRFHQNSLSQLETDALNVVACRRQDDVAEYPLPVLQVKTVDDGEQLVEQMKADIDGKNLVTSVYTDDSEVFAMLSDRLPSHLVRRNAPTTEIDPMEPHQGVYLVDELLGEPAG